MRIIATVALLLVMTGCTTTRPSGPREYLDEQTAATITVVSDPWIFTREHFGAAVDENDFLNLYAIDVNRQGQHQQYIAALQSIPLQATPDTRSAPILELQAGGRRISLEASPEEPRQLGIAQPVAASYTLTSRWFYYPVSKLTLTVVATAPDLVASLRDEGHRVPYVLWRDGRAEMAELTAVLP